MVAVVTVVVVLVVAGLILLALSVRNVQQYEKGVVFRFGRLLPDLREPGLRLIRPFGDRMRKVSVQTEVLGIPAQGAITADNVTVTVDAVVYFRVLDPVKALVNVRNYPSAVSQIAQTSLRTVIGRADLDTLLSDRDHVNAELKKVMDEPTEGPWGLRIERVAIKDIALPDTMMRSMSKQAEAERERRARIISADGEFQASQRLTDAAATMADTPGALQLRLLQTVVEVSAEKNSTLVMPFPVEMLRFFEARQDGSGGDGAHSGDGHPAAGRTSLPEALASVLPEVGSPATPVRDPGLSPATPPSAESDGHGEHSGNSDDGGDGGNAGDGGDGGNADHGKEDRDPTAASGPAPAAGDVPGPAPERPASGQAAQDGPVHRRRAGKRHSVRS